MMIWGYYAVTMVILSDDDINGDYYGVTWFYYPIHYPIYWE